MTRRIQCDGSDSDFSYWSTPSWSRPKSGIRFSLAICKRTYRVSCDCPDAMYRKKEGDLMKTTKSNPCKHAQKLMEIVERRATGVQAFAAPKGGC